MGCRGSEVQILSCRPKTLEKPASYGWFFCACFSYGELLG
nr:MAG TPA: hypothetical protein [Bacteriophage sp.]